jgi:GPH family glycoside/pentoside/hexuronide:cation symporter
MARSFDLITDPIMAWMSDQTSWKMGRRRPFILMGAPFYALFLILFFSPPSSLSG